MDGQTGAGTCRCPAWVQAAREHHPALAHGQDCPAAQPSETYQGEVWAPIMRPIGPWRDTYNEVDLVRLQWTDEALAILVALREILADKTDKAQVAGAERHVKLGLLAQSFIEKLVADKPVAIAIGPRDLVPSALLMYLDASVAQLREMGIFQASEVLRRMGWKTKRGGAHQSPTGRAHGHRDVREVRSPDRHASRVADVRSPERRHTHPVPEPMYSPPRPYGGAVYTSEVRREEPSRWVTVKVGPYRQHRYT
jgi:hypothetical protein